MTQAEMRQRLNELIRERAMLHGDFVLRSGARSTFYLDCRQITLHPEGAYLVASLILERLRGVQVHAVGGPALAAVPIVGAVCATSYAIGRPLAGFVVRKEAKDHGTGNLIEGPLTPGASVVLVEDTLTTGGELLRAARPCAPRAASSPAPSPSSTAARGRSQPCMSTAYPPRRSSASPTWGSSHHSRSGILPHSQFRYAQSPAGTPLIRSGSGLYNAREVVGLQAGAAHQRPIDLRLRAQNQRRLLRSRSLRTGCACVLPPERRPVRQAPGE